MTTATDDSTDLGALRELADDILSAGTEPMLDVQKVGIEFDPDLWTTLAESGLTLLSTPEDRGGTGATLREAAVVLEGAGYHAAPLPIAEHDLLASWLLGIARLPLFDGPMTAAVTDRPIAGSRLVGTIDHVPWASAAGAVIVTGPGFVATLPHHQLTFSTAFDLAGQPADTVHIDAELQPDQFGPIDGQMAAEFRLRGAYARSLQTCGALGRALESACQHAAQRVQFGRPIAKFQAVQALISSAAASLALATTAAHFATEVVLDHGFNSAQGRFAVAVAKIEAARAAGVVCRNVHQVHGAIGFTLDHRLRHFTIRAQSWRSEFGSQREWQHELGMLALDSPNGVWEMVTRLSTAAPEIAPT